MAIDDRRMNLISMLEVMIVETDWENEGRFYPDRIDIKTKDDGGSYGTSTRLTILPLDRGSQRDRKRVTCDSTEIGCDCCIDISSLSLEDHSGS